jgi:glyoxylase-like metal-dependent hydrolase (beta-lactamase superfamily II)
VADVVELAEGVHQLTPQPGINVWVLRGEDGVTLVDTGLAAPGLERSLRRIGVAPRDVVRVLLTHGHPDHAGGLARLRRAGGDGDVLVGAGDLATVRGDAPQPDSDPSTRLGRLMNRLPPPPGFGELESTPGASALTDGDELDLVGGIRVVATPGHSPGHVAFQLLAHHVVIGGDALFNVFRLRPAPGFLCSDIPANLRAVATLADLAPGTLALAHGSTVRGDVSGRLRQLLADAR